MRRTDMRRVDRTLSGLGARDSGLAAWGSRLLAVAMFIVGFAFAQTAAAQDIAVKNARVILTAADPKTATVVGTIDNPGMYATYLTGATADIAERIELRDARKANAVVKEVEIPAFGALTLEARGLHLKLVNLKRPLRAGERIDVMLVNEAQVKTRISAVVAAR